MAGFGWIHTRFRSFDLVWHRFQQRNLTSTKTEKQKIKTIKTHHITKKTFDMKIHKEKNKQKRQNKSIKTWCLRSFVDFVVCVLVLFLVFLFAFWVSSVLFFCLQCFCIFLGLTLYLSKNAAGFKTFFHYKEHQNKLLVVYNLWIKRKTDPKCMKGRGDRLTPPSNTCLGSMWLDFRHAWK